MYDFFYHRDKFSLTLTGFLQVYQREELQMIADLCIKHDVICISDEVYEWLTYDGTKHVKIGKSRTVQVMRLITVLWTFKVTYLFFFFWQPVCQVCGNALSPLGAQARLSVPQDGRWAGRIQQDLFLAMLYPSVCLNVFDWLEVSWFSMHTQHAGH